MEWMTAKDVMVLTGWSWGYVKKRASLDGWRAKGTRPQQWVKADVVKSYQQGRGRVENHIMKKWAAAQPNKGQQP